MGQLQKSNSKIMGKHGATQGECSEPCRKYLESHPETLQLPPLDSCVAAAASTQILAAQHAWSTAIDRKRHFTCPPGLCALRTGGVGGLLNPAIGDDGLQNSSTCRAGVLGAGD